MCPSVISFFAFHRFAGSLRITDNRFAGQLPEELAALSELRVFRIDDNDLSGAIPDGLCTAFDETRPVAYADCSEVACPCCSFCCADGQGCQCIVADSDPARCGGS